MHCCDVHQEWRPPGVRDLGDGEMGINGDGMEMEMETETEMEMEMQMQMEK